MVSLTHIKLFAVVEKSLKNWQPFVKFTAFVPTYNHQAFICYSNYFVHMYKSLICVMQDKDIRIIIALITVIEVPLIMCTVSYVNDNTVIDVGVLWH